MAKQIKIKSTSLNLLNEALQKLKLNDKVTDFTPVIVEADGKFTSIVNGKEEFNPNDVSSTFETEEVENEEQKETKEQLLNKAKDALKQTLTNSKELNDILQKIQDLSKETGYNTWELNKEKNTATLKSKNAAIFKQDNNLCLSHSGKIEIFHSVAELRNWLKEKGYPLPGSDIVIHESVEIKEAEGGRNWVDLLNGYNDKKKADAISTELDNNSHIIDKDTAVKYIDIITDYDDLVKEHQAAFDAWNKNSKDPELFKKEQETKAAMKAFYKDNNLDTLIPAVNEYKKSLNRNDKTMSTLGKPIPKEILQAANRQKPEVKFNRSYLEKDTDVEECCGGACVSAAALGPAVAYTASPKKKKKEEIEDKEDLQEAFQSLIPGDTKMYPGKRELVNKFLTWYKRNKAAIEAGEIKLPKDIEDSFDNIIEPTYMNNSSDSVSRVWKNIIEKRLIPVAAKVAEVKKIPENKVLAALMNKPNQQICDLLSAELNSYIPEGEDYETGKVHLIPGNSVVDIKHDNPNYQQRQNWQKIYYQAKNGGAIDQTEAMVKTFNDFKKFIKKPKVYASQFSSEELELMKKYNLATIKPEEQEESTIFESAKNHPWLNKILGQRLTEDDSPADFATGSPISSDMGSTDTTSTSTTSTSTSTDTSATPDIDMGGGEAPTNPSFGDINIDAGGYSPDEGGEEGTPMPVDMPEYRIIDVLMDDDTNDIKVKVQDTESKETEIKNLEEIDV